MQLQRIQQAILDYEAFLGSGEAAEQRLFYWESQRIFQECWDLEAGDFAGMYEQSLQNTKTRRLWTRENYEPKRMMLRFISMLPDFVRQMFSDLFNETKSVEPRMDRFVFYCDELLQDYKRANPRTTENSHFHNDNYEMISLYLAFRYPDRYAPYRYEVFRELMVKFASPDIPAVNDVERYFKVMRTLYNMLNKNENLKNLHAARIEKEGLFQQESLLLAFDFACFCTSSLEK